MQRMVTRQFMVCFELLRNQCDQPRCAFRSLQLSWPSWLCCDRSIHFWLPCGATSKQYCSRYFWAGCARSTLWSTFGRRHSCKLHQLLGGICKDHQIEQAHEDEHRSANIEHHPVTINVEHAD